MSEAARPRPASWSVLGSRRGSWRWARAIQAGRGVEDLVAGEAEHLQDGVQVGLVERRVRLLAHERLGVEGDAETRGVQHVEVVGAVADRDGLLERDAVLRGEPRQRAGLAGAVDDLPDQAAGEPAVDDLEGVGRREVQPERLGQRVGDLGEPAADDAAAEAQPLQGADQGAGARA